MVLILLSLQVMNDIKTLIESAGDDRELAVDLLELFKEQAIEGIAALSDAVQKEDSKEAVHLAHKLVGSAIACGFIDLSQELRFIETECQREVPDDIEQRLQTVSQLLERGCNEMGRVLADEKLYEKGAYN
ncbi:Hpt domain-containing protein [Verrucomicrobia bacterium S94]|nr:Hpt domain-containing protein [Verrucomicrobia bacterium S94]